jgi:hypothetical protein
LPGRAKASSTFFITPDTSFSKLLHGRALPQAIELAENTAGRFTFQQHVATAQRALVDRFRCWLEAAVQRRERPVMVVSATSEA